MKLTQTTCNRIVSKNFVKCRYYPGKYINLKSGVVIPTNRVLVAMGFLLGKYDNKRSVKTDMILNSLVKLDFSTKKQRKSFNNKAWDFFFKAFSEEKNRKGYQVYNEYCKVFGTVTHEYFYDRLKFWACENEIHMNFKNRLFNRDVVVAY